ncbi:putative toxin-antitoxin system toxin component, PIN family (plasmid) [Skermanella rosea]|uniref:putative toxin-antitoxin system toxin component, PIN family n=1 Tax=Skermanella rosea TaxID=1817965 RepID=UPI0019316ED1|nr:putative toxin-antitoxin system toxin component, PIN family [Skermanella rosea]UEM06754.1 putative toxin-antitoxin system toxin component, PIN family [Skermanella rosea]
MSPPRLVLDTNVLLSALLFRSASMTWLRKAWQAGNILPLASRDTVSELLRVLSYPKFGLTAPDRDDLLADYLPWCETVTIPTPPPAVPKCRDAFDQPFLLLALTGHADALVTGDRDLLALADTFPVPILTPADMKSRLPG